MEESTLATIAEEIINVRRLLEILAKDALKKELEAVATTMERRRIYSLSDGLTSNEEIARRAGVSLRAVQEVLKKLVELGLVVMVKRGLPKRRFEWVPSEWRLEPMEPVVETNVVTE